jgi:hypothetical protein
MEKVVQVFHIVRLTVAKSLAHNFSLLSLSVDLKLPSILTDFGMLSVNSVGSRLRSNLLLVRLINTVGKLGPVAAHYK